METVHVAEELLLAAVNLELKKANEASIELNRLMSTGHLNSQMGLDVAMDVKSRLTKAYDLLACIDTPGAKYNQLVVLDTITRQDLIIERIKLSL